MAVLRRIGPRHIIRECGPLAESLAAARKRHGLAAFNEKDRHEFGKPAARVGDHVTTVGPPSAIIVGSPTVLIAGKPAARVGDRTTNGAQILTGCPTVLIGG